MGFELHMAKFRGREKYGFFVLSSSCYLSKQMDGGQSRCSSLSPAMRDADGLQHRDE